MESPLRESCVLRLGAPAPSGRRDRPRRLARSPRGNFLQTLEVVADDAPDLVTIHGA
jgi:hypothetical protein